MNDISYLMTEELKTQNKRLEALLENAQICALHWLEKLVEMESEVARLKAQLDQEKEQSKYLASLLDPDLVAGMSDMEKTRDRLAMAKAALGEFAELSNYSINPYSEVQWDGPIASDAVGANGLCSTRHPAKICKHPWNYADKILEELESSSAPLTTTPD